MHACNSTGTAQHSTAQAQHHRQTEAISQCRGRLACHPQFLLQLVWVEFDIMHLSLAWNRLLLKALGSYKSRKACGRKANPCIIQVRGTPGSGTDVAWCLSEMVEMGLTV
eukprot:1159302-Pelagomonas_calceolata.AAC.18